MKKIGDEGLIRAVLVIFGLFILFITSVSAEQQVISTIVSVNASNGSATIGMGGGNVFSFQCENTAITQNLSVVKDITCQNQNITTCQSNLDLLSTYFYSYAQNCSKWYDHQSVVAGYSNCSDSLEKERTRSNDLQSKVNTCTASESSLTVCESEKNTCLTNSNQKGSNLIWYYIISGIVGILIYNAFTKIILPKHPQGGMPIR